MNFEAARNIADAVLYEGYILYPYRASALKNQHRFHFGTLLPVGDDGSANGDHSQIMQTECLVTGERPEVEIRVRFLHQQTRELFRVLMGTENSPSAWEPLESLQIGDQVFTAWQEATEREVIAPIFDVSNLTIPLKICFSFPASCQQEALQDDSGNTVGMFVRQQASVSGQLTITAQALEKRLFRLQVKIENHTFTPGPATSSRKDNLSAAFLSTHTLLGVRGGEFISLLDPPAEFQAAAADCRNLGTWPVLAGNEGSRDLLLSSPIILYDYPRVAPESAGNFFDGTEIDEMLALRVMTLTDAERNEMRQVDIRASQILDRVNSLPSEHLLKLHGAVRGLKGALR